ncbi:MAG: hypothetical protein J6X18_12545 [Bacteroidales bacterium]|nr:hypothetical protein [Bacteroidales bacterium]
MSGLQYWGSDTLSALDAMDETQAEIDELQEKGNVSGNELTKLYYKKMIQGLPLNTGQFRF